MRLVKLALGLFLGCSVVWAAPPSRTQTYTAGNVINPSHVTENEDNLYTYVQSGVDTIANNAVETADIQDAAVTAAKLATGAATTTVILDNTITATDLAATLTFADGDFLDFSSINASSTTEGLKLPQATSCASATAEGQLCWDSDNDTIQVGDGSASVTFRPLATSNVLTFTRTAAAGSGAQTVAHGIGVDPSWLMVMCEDAADDASWGFADDDDDEATLVGTAFAGSASLSSGSSNLISVNDGGGNAMSMVYTSDDTTNITITWTKTNSGMNVSCLGLVGG